MENASALTLFFVFIFISIILFVVGLVLLFRPAVSTPVAEVRATIIDVQQWSYDDVVTIRYTVKDKVYTYTFYTSRNIYKEGQAVWFKYNPDKPSEPAGKKANGAVHITGIILVVLAMISMLVGTVWAYVKMGGGETTSSKNTSLMGSLFGSKK
jgi:flagellar basal body-associated protein FliL